VLAFVTTWESRTSGAMCGMRATAATLRTIVGKEELRQRQPGRQRQRQRQPGRAGSQSFVSLQL